MLFLSLATLNLSAQDLGPIRSGIVSTNIELRRDALFQIINLKTEEASRLALPALSDPNEIVRATAASAIIHIPKPEALRALIPLLSDKSEFVRRESAHALGS